MKGMYVLNYLPGNQFIIFHDFDQEVVAELLFHSQNFFMFLAMQTPLFLTHVYGKVPSLMNLVLLNIFFETFLKLIYIIKFFKKFTTETQMKNYHAVFCYNNRLKRKVILIKRQN